jgi:3',5'-cyclic-nucleotide phosphodiesterase
LSGPGRARVAAIVLAGLMFSLAARAAPPVFTCLAVGASGGVDPGDLTSWLVAPAGSSDYLGLDAGTVRLQPPVRVWLISHPHLDHVAGLVIASTDDRPATVVGLDSTIDVLRDDLFNWRVWPNFGSEGVRPLCHYLYRRVRGGERFTVSGSSFELEAWPLSHGGVRSTAFLVFRGSDALAYLGDTGPDSIERSTCLRDLWRRLAPLARNGQLRGLFVECSYPNGRSDSQLFGHLTPAWLLTELHRFAREAGSLRGLSVIVTHIKPTPPGARASIERQLGAGNDLGVGFRFPRQGERFDL